MMDRAGLVQSREPDAVEHRCVSPIILLGKVHGGGVLCHQTLDGNVAPVIVKRGDEAGQQGGRIQHGTAVHA